MTAAGIVLLDITMSLDGYIAGPDDSREHPLGLRGGERIHDWFFTGDTTSRHNDGFRASGRSMEVLDEFFETTGALVVGRRMYDFTDGWQGSHPLPGVPVFVVTHAAPETVPSGSTAFTFVTDGVERAVEQARRAAGDRHVVVNGGANVAQQCLVAGLLDEIQVHVAPTLLGDGRRLFDRLDEEIQLETVRVIEAPGVTHLRFRVLRQVPSSGTSSSDSS